MATWNEQLVEQIDVHWTHLLRPRLEGLTDEEYFWQPSPSWTVHARGVGDAPVQAGSGEFVIDFAFPAPEPAPFTTIAWRLGHLVVGVLAMRNASHFGRAPVDYQSFAYAGTAAAALAQLDEEYDRWTVGVRGLGEDGLARLCGPAEGPYAEVPYSTLVLHINRELIHHGSEIALLRDLFLHTHSQPQTERRSI